MATTAYLRVSTGTHGPPSSCKSRSQRRPSPRLSASASHHSPLYQDKAVTPPPLKDIFTPIWAGPLLALLSPQSVRRARDPGNPTATDSVCLNEIEYAQGACKIPIVPVQVVSCEAPFLIFRLHQINFRYWGESEATYQAGLNQICAAIAEAIQSRKSPERLWAPSLEP